MRNAQVFAKKRSNQKSFLLAMSKSVPYRDKSRPKIAVVLSTCQRSEVLAGTLASLARQTLKPDQVIISATSPSDLPALPSTMPEIQTVFGSVGLCFQRNRARTYLHEGVQLVFFLDDDVELARDYLEQMIRVFHKHPEVGLLGGNVIAEGVTRTEAIQILAVVQPQNCDALHPVRSLYGCNMCVRTDIFLSVDFDENLRLMCWLEDFDWSVRAGMYGTTMYNSAALTVHLKVASGRVSGYRFGYAQVLNPFYLYRKGIITTIWEVLERHWIRLLISNLSRFILRDKKIDRIGRLRGNLRAFIDIACGRIDPRRVELL